ncbi:hypothetical protein PRZ48_001940 [Zasmidium cellare]|uniref:Uncharacterized protein n=1 Tax=Zasmidium cellare TaxID=395010 RepID=A0ABR0F2W0_ZASCE|nr:hypothetical protein PRZ48_001940 [Zasmidium cellare]
MPKLSDEESKARSEQKARRMEQAELAAQNPRPLEVDAATIQQREEICTQLLAYYEHLVKLYLPEEALKRPPEEGWPYINAERFAFLDKTDAVIDLYKHLPYISQDDEAEYKIYRRTIAVDYTGEYFKYRHVRRQNGEMEPPQYYEQMEGTPTWPERLDDPRHIAVLAQIFETTDQYILLDTRDGKVAHVFPRDRQDSVTTHEYDSIRQLIDRMTEAFRKLLIVPIAPTELIATRMTSLPDEDIARLKELFPKHGWYSPEYNKDACMHWLGLLDISSSVLRKRALTKALNETWLSNVFEVSLDGDGGSATMQHKEWALAITNDGDNALPHQPTQRTQLFQFISAIPSFFSAGQDSTMLLNLQVVHLALLGYALASPAREVFSQASPEIVTKVVYRDTPVGDLTNLPTLEPATYCTQTLANGKELLVTKTGTTCPFLSASPSTTPSLASLPPSPLSSSQSTPGSSDQNLDSKCPIFQKLMTDPNGKTSWMPIDQDVGVQMCMDYCSEKMKALLDQNQVASATCLAFGDPIQWQEDEAKPCLPSERYYPIVQHARSVTLMISQVTCKTFTTAISSVVETGLNALPGLGGLIGGAATLTLQAAQVAGWTFDNEQAAAGGFQTWLEKPSGATGPPDDPSTWLPDKICGNKYTPEEGEKVFAAFDVASSSIGAGALWKSLPKDMHWPPPYPKGRGSLDDMLGYLDGLKPKPKDDAPKGKPDPPKSEPPADDPPKSKAPEKSSDAKACTRTNGKRSPGKGQQDPNCADKVTITHILDSKTVDAKHTMASMCDWAAWPDACAHYYSAIHDNGGDSGKSRFTCADDNTSRDDQRYVKDWKKQHNEVWRAFENPDYVFPGKAQKHEKKDLNCQADEWPPAYFVPKAEVNRPEWGQRIRFLPREENGGAASLWRAFCANNDGGKGNGQRVKVGNDDPNGDAPKSPENPDSAPINKNLLEGKKIPRPDEKREGKDGTVTEVYKMLTFTRAVFEIQFNFGDKPPSKQNDWYLKENPCWPEDIAPDDPGFVLLTNDPYYNHHPEAKATIASYAEPPSRKRFDEANAARVKRFGAAAEIPDKGVPAADPPPPKARRPNPGSGSKFLRKRLEIVGDRLHLRDLERNVTRPLTDKEMQENVEITRCKDRKCLQEEDEDDNDSLIVPGVGRPSVPSENTAVPTLVTRIVPRQMEVRRSTLSADLPLITAIAVKS